MEHTRKEIAKFSPLGHIILTGDFNARTGVLLDYIAEDSDQYISLPPEYELDIPVPRSSENRAINNFGKELIELCIAGQLRIVNGRVQPDINRGVYTCHTHRGNSVVDYVIISTNFLNRINQFEVGEISPLSDHCPLTFQLASNAGSIFSIQKLCQQVGSLFQDILERMDPQQDDPQQNDLVSESDDLCTPPLMKIRG